MPAYLMDQSQNAPDSFPLARPLADAVAVAEAALADDIAWALAQFADRRARYALYHAYLDGEHRLTFATKGYREAFRALLAGLRCNLCPRVVHALTDRLKIVGFAPHDTETAAPQPGAADPPEVAAARMLWQDMRLARHENRVYTEAVATGDAYLLIWPDPTDAARPIAYPQRADQMVVRYDDERPDLPIFAAKLWREAKRFYLSLYYADRIEKYVTISDGDMVPTKATAFEPRQVAGEAWPVPNPYGRVPVFHYAFEGGIGECGKAELRDIIPLQDALNKALADLVVASEFGAFPMKWATGVAADADEEEAIKTAIDRLLTVASPEAHLGSFAPTDLQNYTRAIDEFFGLAAKIKGIPLHTLLMSGDFPSGESLKTAEAPLVARAQDTQIDFGDVWEEALAFAILVATGTADAQLTAVWAPAESRAEKDHTETVAIRRERIGISQRQAWRELDYSEDEIERMEQEKDDEGVAAVDAMDALLTRQGATGSADAALNPAASGG